MKTVQLSTTIQERNKVQQMFATSTRERRTGRNSHLKKATRMVETTHYFLLALGLAMALSISEAFLLPHSSAKTRSVASFLPMVRNIDFPEALIFYDDSHDDAVSVLLEDDGTTARPGLLDLLQECQDVNTPTILIVPSSTTPASKYSQEVLKKLQVFEEVSLPTTAVPGSAPSHSQAILSLWEAIQSLTIQPAGFGGSSGFGRKLADPERSPIPAHVVVFATHPEVCSAARHVGMRVLCLEDTGGDGDLADAMIYDYQNLYLEDVATPGSFWLNPPYPRDDEGDKVDILYDLTMMNDSGDNTIDDDDISVESGDVDSNELSSSKAEKDMLQAILDDLDPL